MNQKERLDRFLGFRLFSAWIAEKYFGEIANNDISHQNRINYCSFYVCPKGRHGGHDERLVEVFYGYRPISRQLERVEGKNGIPWLQRRTIRETGASLTYQYHENGYAMCCLYPFAAEGFRRIEDYIILCFQIDPHLLTAQGVLKSHWKYFVSYSEVTSVDGTPSLWDKAIVKWLMFTRARCVNEKIVEAPYKDFFVTLIRWVLTIGLSGFLLKVLDVIFPKPCP